MAHPGIFPRRGSSTTGSSSASAMTTAAGASVSNNVISTDDYQSPLVIQPPPPAGSSSPGPQHHPQSLNLLSQSQLHSQTLQAGAQVKKKSGFQITSVTPAQISVSTNNSITEDTESCDDLDESHTEDLSSSEILDVSLSRAGEMVGAEKSSSEETLNNFHEAETPGAVSPNQPPHPLQHVPQHGPMVNGTGHHHQPHHHSHHHHPGHRHQVHVPLSEATPTSLSSSGLAVGGGVSVAGALTSGALPSVTQKLSASLAVSVENVSVSKAGIVPKPLAASASGTGTLSTAAAVSVVNPTISNVSDVNMLRSAGGPTGGLPVGLVNLNGGSAVMGGSSGNMNLIQQQCVGPTATVGMTATGTGPPSVMGSTVVAQPTSTAPVPQPQPQQAQAAPVPASTSSRFRVVKLDTNSEPFKKGRWTCTEYYEKEPPPDSSVAGPRAVESLRQPVAEGGVVCTDRESTSVPGLHYGESSGEIGGPIPSHTQDYAASQGVLGPTHGIPQSQIGQDVGLLKTSVAQSIPAGLGTVQQQAIINQGSQQTAVVPQQQVAYTQAGQSTRSQGLPVASQPLGVYPATQQPTTAAQGAPTHIMPTQHQSIAQASVGPTGTPHPLPHISGIVPSVPLTANSQPVVSMPSAISQTLPQGHPQQAAHVSQPSLGGILQPLARAQPLPSLLPVEQQQPPTRTQGPGGQLPSTVTMSQVTSNVPPGLQLDPKSGLGHGSLPYTGLPSLTATQLEDAQRLLFQHQSLLSLPKLAAGDSASGAGASVGQEEGSGSNALPATASLFPLKNMPVDGEEDR
ncbi:hypothetical protein AGOR_G00216200 [Albula goreensis]|uniref:TSC22 domain family protein 1 n=1 Tax=Albula goreensis TaxID=1534307 RepID=A0A8T3CM67_9TELE|nr:hypothetical protein AGOR_G00216200 [Albula goreensis]